MRESAFENVLKVNKTKTNFQSFNTLINADNDEEEMDQLSEVEAKVLEVDEVMFSRKDKAKICDVDFVQTEVSIELNENKSEENNNNLQPKKVRSNVSKKNENCQNYDESFEKTKCAERRFGPILNTVSRLINIDQSFKYNF